MQSYECRDPGQVGELQEVIIRERDVGKQTIERGHQDEEAEKQPRAREDEPMIQHRQTPINPNRVGSRDRKPRRDYSRPINAGASPTRS
jgi:hypothetical protein